MIEVENEPRTLLDIVQDLLDFARDRQWSGQLNTSCHCHPEYGDCCPKCDVLQYKRGAHEQSDHEPGCELATLIREVDAFIDAERASLARR